MTIIKEDNRIGPGVCCECGGDAMINHGGKWYCAVESDMGVMNLKGFCNKANTVTKKKGLD